MKVIITAVVNSNEKPSEDLIEVIQEQVFVLLNDFVDDSYKGTPEVRFE